MEVLNDAPTYMGENKMQLLVGLDDNKRVSVVTT
jgi:hypothetical protein